MFLRLFWVPRISARLSNSKLKPTTPASRTAILDERRSAQLIVSRFEQAAIF